MLDLFADAEVISVYTRQQAIEEGFLVEASFLAKDLGIKESAALTSAVWGEYVAVPEGLKDLQDETGRLWDILWMATLAVQKASPMNIPKATPFVVYVQNNRRSPKPVKLKAHIGFDEHGKIVWTIMLPHED